MAPQKEKPAEGAMLQPSGILVAIGDELFRDSSFVKSREDVTTEIIKSKWE